MTTFKFIVGDWSDDGHGKTETMLVDIPNEFTFEVLKENYLKNKTLFGFGYSDFAEGYEDSSISEEQVEKLREAGLNIVVDVPDEENDKFFSETHPDYTNNVALDDDVSIFWFEDREQFVKTAMFIIGNGLPNWEWKLAKEEIPVLVGGFEAITNDHAGYGFF